MRAIKNLQINCYFDDAFHKIALLITLDHPSFIHSLERGNEMASKLCLTLVLILLTAVAVFAVPSHHALANASFSSSSVTCSSFQATGTVTTTYVAVRIWNLTDGQYEGGPALIDSYYNVGAPTAYFAASGGAFSFTVNFPAQDIGDVLVARIYATNTPVFGGWDNGTFPQIQVPCSGFQGAPIPAGFVLRTITCNTPVYTLPGDQVVGSNAVTSGQTWFVNPTTTTAGGSSWTEIFVSGFNNAWIPSNCVGVAPAGY
jgi:hypothetical protein